MPIEQVIINGFECDGTWFVPEAPDAQLNGHLKLVPGETGTLKIIGSFRGFNYEHSPSFLCGIATDGTYVTLYKSQSHERMNTNGQGVTIFRPEIAFLGAHFAEEGDLDFESVYFTYHNLDEWLAVSGFEISQPFTPGKTEILYRQPDSIPLYSNDDYEVQIFFGYRGPNLNHVQKHVTVEQSVSVMVRRKQSRNLKNYLRIHNHITNFLHLATHDSVYIKDISARVKVKVADDNDEIERIHRVHVFVAVDALPPAQATDPHEMAFVYADIKERLNEVMSAWFQKSDVLRHACNVLFQSLYGRKLYLDNKIIGVTQAVEEIHRRVFGGKYEDTDRYLGGLYQQLIRAIPDSVTGDHRKSLVSRLKYANEYSLRKRIRELIKVCPKEIVRQMIGNRVQIEAFIESLVDLRNSLSHHGDNSIGLSSITSRAYWMIQALKLVLEMFLFKQICLSDKDICTFLNRNYIYTQEIAMIRRNIVASDRNSNSGKT
jgi:ApeA N-terminal domain 1